MIKGCEWQINKCYMVRGLDATMKCKCIAPHSLRLSPQSWPVTLKPRSSVSVARASPCRRQTSKQPLRLRERANLSGRVKATDPDSPDWSRSSEQASGGGMEASTSDRTESQTTRRYPPLYKCTLACCQSPLLTCLQCDGPGPLAYRLASIHQQLVDGGCHLCRF